jgi:hypothetical protein
VSQFAASFGSPLVLKPSVAPMPDDVVRTRIIAGLTQ